MDTYTRVLPRDLFNDAKLLKCLGFLTLRIHDNQVRGLTFEYDGAPFDIRLTDSGELFVANLYFQTSTGHPVSFFTNYNDKSNFPLLCNLNDEIERVFDETGDYAETFIDLLGAANATAPHGERVLQEAHRGRPAR